MEDAALVGVLHRVGQRGKHLRGQSRRDEATTIAQPGGHRGSFAIGRGQIADGPNLAGLVERHDVGMVQGRGSAGVTDKPSAGLDIEQGPGPRDLQRDRPSTRSGSRARNTTPNPP